MTAEGYAPPTTLARAQAPSAPVAAFIGATLGACLWLWRGHIQRSLLRLTRRHPSLKRLPSDEEARRESDEDVQDVDVLCRLGLEAIKVSRHLQRAARIPCAEIQDMGTGQVGGHRTLDGKTVMRTMSPHFVLKPMQAGTRGIKEVRFYEEIEALREAGSLGMLHAMESFLCEYYGVLLRPMSSDTASVHKAGHYIVLKDITHGLRHPCILDLKMGTRTYEPDASDVKKRKEMDKYPAQEITGFRFVGMRVYNALTKGFTFYDKSYGCSMPPDSVSQGFVNFFSNGNGLRVGVVRAVHAKVEALIQCFQKQTRYHFISSSLLIVYEGADTPTPNVDVRMIDFAHIRCGEM